MLAVLLLVMQSSQQPVYDGHLRQLDVHAPRIEAPTIQIDGVLDDAVWRQAALLTGFSQYRPVDSRPADDSTQVLVFYGPDAIYFGIRAFELHGSVVRATLADRDNIGADDNIQILLDTFKDRRRALLFAVNPLGAQQDGVRSEGLAGAAGGGNAGGRFDGVVDLNPDYVYDSKGRVTPTGFEVEVRIPFKSLRYQSGQTQDWGIQIVRVTQHSAYEDTWTPVVRANASFLIQSGTLKSLTNLKRGLVMDVSPEFTSHVEGGPAAPGSSSYQYGDVKPDLGVNVRWGVTQNLSATGTVNPDFSQIEADVGQITLNQRFALFFPEKRPFFLEGLEQFDTPNALIYTRQISAPVVGAKLTGKVGGTGVAYIGAVDDNAFSPTNDHPIFNLLRLRRDVGASSTVGLAYTDRSEGDASNRVLSADARLIWNKGWFSSGQIAGSWTHDGTGTMDGTLWDATMYDYTGRSYGNHGEFVGVSPDFAALSGFVNRTNVVYGRIFNRFTAYGKPRAFIENATTFLLIQPTWHYNDFFKLRRTFEGSISQQLQVNIRGGWFFSAQWQNTHQRFDSVDYARYSVDTGTAPGGSPFDLPRGIYNMWGGIAAISSPNNVVKFDLSLGYESGAIFAEASEGRALNLYTNLEWRPTSALRLAAQFPHQRITRVRDGSWFSTANIPRLKVEYQLTRSIFFRYVGQYFAQERDTLRDARTGAPLLIDSVPQPRKPDSDFRNDFLFSYKPVPGTVLFFGYGTSLTEQDPLSFRRLTRASDGFFLKASYLFRL